MYRYLRTVLKWLGRRLDFLTLNRVIIFFIPAYLVGLFIVYNEELIPERIERYLPFLFSFIALVCVLKAFTERKLARMSWLLIVMTHFWIALAVAFNEHFKFAQVHLYLSGIAVAGTLGFLCLRWLKFHEGNIDLDQFH